MLIFQVNTRPTVHPEQAVAIATSTTLPFISILKISNVKFLLQNDISKYAKPLIEVPGCNIWVVPVKVARNTYSLLLGQLLPVLKLG
jgi:hypothetical protein